MTWLTRTIWFSLLVAATLPLGSCSSSSSKRAQSDEDAAGSAAQPKRETRRLVQVPLKEIPWQSPLAASDAPARQAIERARTSPDGRAYVGGWVIVDSSPRPAAQPVAPPAPAPTPRVVEQPPPEATAVRPAAPAPVVQAPPAPSRRVAEGPVTPFDMGASDVAPPQPVTRPPAAVQQPTETVTAGTPAPTAPQPVVTPVEPRQEIVAQPPTSVPPAPIAPPQPVAPAPPQAVQSPSPVRAVPPPAPPEPRIVRSVEVEHVRPPEPEEYTEGYMVDAMVGQINGIPVYASNTFHDIGEDVLERTGRQKDRLAFERDVSELVLSTLTQVITDALILAEAEADLSEPERMGLLGFVAEEREKLLAQGLGSRSLTEDVLQDRLGRSIQEELAFRRDQLIINRYMQTKLYPKIHVTRREVERYYQSNLDYYKPEPTVTIRVIIARDESTADNVEAALEAGQSFEDVAQKFSSFQPDRGGLMEPVETRLHEFSALSWDNVNDEVRKLEPGQHSPRTAASDRLTAWVQLVDVQGGEERPISEAYLEIEDRLQAMQYDQLSREYLSDLLRKGTYTPVHEMVDPLVEVAMNRFAQPEPE